MGRILYCHCAYARVVPADTKLAVLKGLTSSGADFDAVPDLCEMAAARDPKLAEFAAGESPLRIVACYPRAVKWLFHAAGTPLEDARVTVVNMREGTGAAALAQLKEPA